MSVIASHTITQESVWILHNEDYENIEGIDNTLLSSTWCMLTRAERMSNMLPWFKTCLPSLTQQRCIHAGLAHRVENLSSI